MRIRDTWTALVTPLTSDLSIDWEGLRKNVEFQMSQGIAGLLPVGTTGESPTLDWEEHNKVIGQVATACRGKKFVLAGTGSNSTCEAIESTRHAVEAGVDAVLLVDCYYNGPSSRELRDEYHGAVAAEFPDTLVVPYVIPGRTGCALGVEDLAILADRFPNISTVKEATGDLDRMERTRSLLGDDFSIMSGDDDMTLTMMTDPSIRADGVISVMTNIIPGAIARMVQMAASGDIDGARKISEGIAPILSAVTVKVLDERMLPSGETVIVTDRYRNPAAVKTLMNGLGMPSGPCRRPLGKMSLAGVEVVRSAARSVWEKSPEALTPVAEFYGIDIEARLSDDAVWTALGAR